MATRTLATDLRDAATELNPAGQEIYRPGGQALEAGQLLRSPALASTLRALAEEGPEALYGGEVGESAAAFLEGEGSPLRPADFRAHEPTWVDPISTSFRGRRVHTIPPNSQGLTLLLMLGMADRLDLEAAEPNSAALFHDLVEIKKIAFADRNRWIADPTMADVPVERLLDPSYLDERAALVGDRAAESREPGFGTEATAETETDGGGDTVYLMAVDSEGNAVSWIQSLFHGFGSGLLDPETGVLFQNRGALFTLEEGHPNRVAPGKRPYHTLTPLMALRSDGSLGFTLGTPGGDSQTQSLLQIMNNLLLFGMTPQEAIEAPRFRSYDGRRVAMEARVPAPVRRELQALGHELEVVRGWTSTFGGAQMILVEAGSGTLTVGSDPRREAYGLAY